MRHVAASLFTCAIAWAVSSPVLADDPPSAIYFIAMRAPDVDPVPRFVSLSASATDSQSAAVTGCDGQTYYATPDDASVVSAALSNGNVVELASGPTGTAAQDSAVVCVMLSGS
jgi:hypothetical protein